MLSASETEGYNGYDGAGYSEILSWCIACYDVSCSRHLSLICAVLCCAPCGYAPYGHECMYVRMWWSGLLVWSGPAGAYVKVEESVMYLPV